MKRVEREMERNRATGRESSDHSNIREGARGSVGMGEAHPLYRYHQCKTRDRSCTVERTNEWSETKGAIAPFYSIIF